MDEQLKNIILQATNSYSVRQTDFIQSLWSGYGEIIRAELDNDRNKTVIVKYVVLPSEIKHPFGWNTSNSHLRKVKSYEVEMNWYNLWSNKCTDESRIPKSYTAKSNGSEFIIVLEDLDASGFPVRRNRLNKSEVKVCLKWLANFHATFLNEEPENLWETGTYWHLATRPDEQALIDDITLQKAAGLIDNELNNCKYKTLVHGDAKLANFCFSKDMNKVAAVDFQYVGGGCGMKDVVYFLESALDEKQCKNLENELLDYYFKEMKQACSSLKKEINWLELETEWRNLYYVSWVDFYRFLAGWSPEHYKLSSNSQKMVSEVIKRYL